MSQGNGPGGSAGGAGAVGGADATAGTVAMVGGEAAGGAAEPAGAGGQAGQDDGCLFQSCECEEDAKRACGPEKEIGICKQGVQTCAMGSWGECTGSVEKKPRDCTSAVDNDCDGLPDDTIDEACKCIPGTKGACGDHPGYDGNGPCQAGERLCMGNGNTGVWSACTGSVAPKATDRCDVANDDNCDGQKNGGCTCLSGEKSTCLDVYGSKGVCSTIALTCSAAGKWPSSANCTTGKAEVCAGDNKDENCDGQVNEGCSCVDGTFAICGDCDEGMMTCSSGKYGVCNKVTPSLKGPKLLCIKAGTFDMGNAAIAADGYEKPVHSVSLPAFWLDETEVTAAQYDECYKAAKCTKPPATEAACDFEVGGRTSWPINCVDQVQAKAYCAWAGKRLPIEEEWEYGARGTTGFKYPWGNVWSNANANFGNGSTEPTSVASYPGGKSPFGLYDMVGNVHEWTASYPCSYASSGITPCPVNTSVIWRGASYNDLSGIEDETTTFRTFDDSNGTNYATFGFRCAKNK
jgi:formylglycine-generating enzyme required for sulfatase activity